MAGILAKLNQMQQFAEKAWETTRLQKLLDLFTFIGVMHNAAFLSREVGETLGYVADNILATIGVQLQDETGEQINTSGLVGNSISNFFKTLLGEDVYNGIAEFWNKASTILRSASLIIWTVRGIFDGTQEVLEWTAENTGKIGNALKKWGAVGFNAYGWMAESVKSQDRVRRRYGRILDGLEAADDTASSFAMVTGEVREITDEVQELGEQRQQFKDAVEDLLPGTDPDNSEIPLVGDEAIANAVGPAVTPADMERSDNATP
jgi:hypothetical protein